MINLRNYSITINMREFVVMNTDIKFKQYDFGTSFIDVALKSNDDIVDVNNFNICSTFKIRKTIVVDGNHMSQSSHVVNIENNTFRIMIPNEILMHTGKVQLEILLFDKVSNNRITSQMLTFEIISSLDSHQHLESDIINAEKYPILTNLIKDVNDLSVNSKQINDDMLLTKQKVEVLNESVVSLENERNKNEIQRVNSENQRVLSFENLNNEIVRNLTSNTEKIDNKILTINNSINDIESRFNALSPEQSTNSEVQLARTSINGVTYESLKERLDAIEQNQFELWETIEG